VIAFGKGGVTETVHPLGKTQAPTGVFFDEQSVAALAGAVRRFEEHANAFDPAAARANAARFDRPIFKEKIRAFLAKVTPEGRDRLPREAPRARA
jgi:hypothetical protein